MDLKNN